MNQIINYRNQNTPNGSIQGIKVLQLCCFTNLWGEQFQVESYDLRLKKDIFDIPQDYPGQFDLVCAAPPCDQFTKANAHHWQDYPEQFVKIAQLCFDLCKQSGGLWFLENPPGRIEKFIPGLKQFRTINWRDPDGNKEYILYSNFIIMQAPGKRYAAGRDGKRKFCNQSKKQREAWNPLLVESIKSSI